MTNSNVEIFDPRSFALYAKEDIIIHDQIGYFVYNQIPFYFEIHSNDQNTKRFFSPFLLTKELFLASLLFSNKRFPTFVFSRISYGSIYIKTDDEITNQDLIAKVKKIVKGEEKIPILFDPYKDVDFDEAQRIIKQTRNEKEYIDFFHAKQISLETHIDVLSKSFTFSEFDVEHASIESFYNLFLSCPRYVHIALHYIINAARLISNFFTEDAAINLHLAGESIIWDYMNISGIKNKRLAIEKLFLENLHFDEELFDWFIELYDARNEFLAHIDENMFTALQRTSDPDAYCYDHYEDICNLVIAYIEFRKKIAASARK